MNAKSRSAAPDPTRWRLGTSSVIFQSQSRSEIRAFVSAGIRDVELRVTRQSVASEDFASHERLTSIVEEAGMRLWSVHLPFGPDWDISAVDEKVREDAVKRQREVMRSISRWGPVKAIIHPSYEPIPDDERENRLNRCGEALRILSHDAQSLGFQLCVECLPRTCLGNTAEEIDYLVDQDDTGGLGVCCDVNHLLNETPQEFVARIGPRVVTVHMSDYDGLDERHWLPGRGVIEWNEVIRALCAVGYEGPFMFEVSLKANPEIEGDIPGNLAASWDRLLRRFGHGVTGGSR